YFVSLLRRSLILLGCFLNFQLLFIHLVSLQTFLKFINAIVYITTISYFNRNFYLCYHMEIDTQHKISQEILLKAFNHMMLAKAMADIYEENRSITTYVHSTSRGHEAIQLATAYQLTKEDWVSPYYRDDSLLLGIGFEPYRLMLQLLAKADDPFSGGRSYYSHPSSLEENLPKIIHQSSATGMQAIPTTGVAQGIKYIQEFNLKTYENNPVVICSMGDNSVTEGEVSEAFQFAALHQLPIIFLVQDNEWGISVT